MIGKEVGTYRITEKIGEGGMGSVYKGIDLMLERDVAIKMLRPELASQPQIVERFRSEAVTLAKLNHPNVALLFSFLTQGEDYFMVMEYVGGQTLDVVISNVGAISFERAVPLFCQALDGIDHAHKMGIIHRDIKPANIMLTDTGSIKVMDFGIARVLGSARVTRHGNVVGTLEYMSPEQIRSEETDARSDVYSLGILLYEMLTGRVPFSNESDYELMRAQIEYAPTPPRTFAPQIPLATEQAIMRAIAKKQEARFQTAGDFRMALLANVGNTTPLNGVPLYPSPVTRMMETPRSSTAADRVRATTLIEEVHQPDRRRASRADQTETRRIVAGSAAPEGLPESGDLQIDPVPALAEAESVPEAARPRRLGALHYIIATVVLLVLISVPVIIIRARAARGPVAPPVQVEENAATQTEPDHAASTSTDVPQTDTVAPDPANPTAISPGQTEKLVRTDASANENKSEKPTTAHADKTEPLANPSTGDSHAAAVPPPVVETPQKDDKSGVTNPTPNKDDKNQNKNAAKKGGGFGGFIKKVFGGNGDKKVDNKNGSPPKQ